MSSFCVCYYCVQLCACSAHLVGAAVSSLGAFTTASKKSKIGVWWSAASMSLFCKLRRSVFSLKHDERSVNSKMNSSHALANRTGASARIIRTSVRKGE